LSLGSELGQRSSLFGSYCFLPQTIETTKVEADKLQSHLNPAKLSFGVIWSEVLDLLGFQQNVLMPN